MKTIHSLEELEHLREQAKHDQHSARASGQIEVIVSMGSCGIAVGAAETLQSISNTVAGESRKGIAVKQSGCLGLCEYEPIVQIVAGSETTLYGNVTTQVAAKIIQQHVLMGEPVQEYILPEYTHKSEQSLQKTLPEVEWQQ